MPAFYLMNISEYFILADSSMRDKSDLTLEMLIKKTENGGKKVKSLKHFCEFAWTCIKRGAGKIPSI